MKNELKCSIKQGVETALSDNSIYFNKIDEISSAIAISGLNEQALISIDKNNNIIQFGVTQAVLVTTGIVGAAYPLVIDPTGITSILCVIGALSGLKGIYQKLPESYAIFILCIYPDKTININKLKEKYDLTMNINEYEHDEFIYVFNALKHLGIISVKAGEVKLNEFVMVSKT